MNDSPQSKQKPVYIQQNLQKSQDISPPENLPKFKLNYDYNLNDIQDKNLILLRAGITQYSIERELTKQKLQDNQLPQQQLQEIQDDIQKIKTSYKFIDPSLTEYGIQQALNQQENVNNLDIHTVFVSPLLRCLQTAYYIFENHPNRKNIQFKVMPITSDILNKSSSIVSDDSNTDQRNFFEQQLKFDYSEFQNYQVPSLWQILQLSDEELVKQYSQLFWQLENDEKFSKSLVKQLQRIFPQNLENYQMGFKRADKFKHLIQQYQNSNNFKQNQKIVVVSHESFLKCLTAKEINQEGYIESHDFNYCQLVPYQMPQ